MRFIRINVRNILCRYYLDKYVDFIFLGFMKIPNLLFSLIFIFIVFPGRSQNVGIGGDVMYNFQTESFGAGARVNIFPNNKLSFVPQISYYPAFNTIHEYYFGLGAEYKFIRKNKFNIYAIGHGAYDSWLN